jgi:hypothetical protein
MSVTPRAQLFGRTRGRFSNSDRRRISARSVVNFKTARTPGYRSHLNLCRFQNRTYSGGQVFSADNLDHHELQKFIQIRRLSEITGDSKVGYSLPVPKHVEAGITITGVSAQSGCWRNQARTSGPSTLGKFRSRSTISGQGIPFGSPIGSMRILHQQDISKVVLSQKNLQRVHPPATRGREK